MKNKFFPIFLISLLCFIFFVFYKGLQNSNIYQPKIDNSKDIPFFEAKTLYENNKINSANLFKKDKYYLLNIWASWCVPCRDEHPFLINLSKQNNLEIIGLNYKDDIEKAKFFLKKFDSPYTLVFSDADGTIAIDWGAYGVPETFLIHNEKIIKKIVGPLNESLLLEIKNLIQ